MIKIANVTFTGTKVSVTITGQQVRRGSALLSCFEKE